MIYRILLIDDEPSITDWLYYLLGETFPDEADVYRTNDSAAALRMLEANPFDIAVLDINMPVIGGMEMLEHICAHRPETRVIFLTGYDQFEYARKAVHPQVAAYVLKNEDDGVLLSAVRSAMRTVDEQYSRKKLMDIAQRRLDAAGPVLRREYVIRLLQGREQTSGMRVKLNIDEAEAVCLLHCSVAQAQDESAAGIDNVFAAGLSVEEAIEEHFLYEGVLLEDFSWAWLLQTRDGHPWGDEALGRLRFAIEAAQTDFNRQTGYDLVFLHSSRPAPFSRLWQAHRALRALKALVPAGVHAVLTDEEPPVCAKSGPCEPPAEAIPALETVLTLQKLMEQGERDKFRAIFSRLAQQMGLYDTLEDPAAAETCMAVSSMLLSNIRRVAQPGSPSLAPLRQRLCCLGRGASGAEAASLFREAADAVFTQQGLNRTTRADGYVQKACKYISEHLDEDLSLISVSEKVLLNPSYFSALFKRVTGMNVSDFIKAERLKRAKALLADNRYRINEIGRSIGYYNAAYFTKFFKIETGLSPIEYRNTIHFL